MFNLFKKTKIAIQHSLESKVNVRETIEAIHNEFDTAGENLLKEANEILSSDYNIEKGERLSKLGFVQSKSAVDAEKVIKTRNKSKQVAERVEYFQQKYPNNKFITEEIVEQICKKYDLVCADVTQYTGNVPEKNVSEIESFKLMEEDCIKHRCWYYKYARSSSGFGFYISCQETEGTWGYLIGRAFGERLISAPRDKDYVYEKPAFKICAPVKDFDTKKMEVKDGYKLQSIPDPIILQPVTGGYLVVSKWGLEASDEVIVNENHN